MSAQIQKIPKLLNVLVGSIVLAASVCTSLGIFSKEGPGSYVFQSIRGKPVTIYGKGLYQHMSAEVAPQGIAQDYVTLLIGLPVLLISFFWARRGSLRARFVLAGVLGYCMVTYLFYLVMAMYNYLFLGYVLLGLSFFAFLTTTFSFNGIDLPVLFQRKAPVKQAGRFLVFVSIAIALLWLNIVVPPLLDGTLIPIAVEHYTTLIVQGLDLALLLPSAFIIGWYCIRKKPLGLLFAPVYLVFLTVLMTALTAKVIAMWQLGVHVFPVIVIIPAFNVITGYFAFMLVKNIQD